MAVFTVGVLVLIAVPGLVGIYLFAVVFGLASGCRSPAQPGIVAEFLGMGRIGLLIGVTFASAQLVGVVAPYFTGYIYDATGSYVIAFIVNAGLCAAGAYVVFGIKKKPTTVAAQDTTRLESVESHS